MVNYQNGKIYKIESHLGNKIYIGSTTKEYLSQRMDAHRSDYKRWKNDTFSLTNSFKLFDEYGLENCQIVLLESYPCNSKDELTAKEAHYIKTNDCVNKIVPQRSSKEYREDNKERIKKWQKEYQEVNKDKRKEYYEANKDSINANKKEYHEANKDYFSLLKNEVVQCSCGKTYTHSNRVRHRKSAFHINNKKE